MKITSRQLRQIIREELNLMGDFMDLIGLGEEAQPVLIDALRKTCQNFRDMTPDPVMADSGRKVRLSGRDQKSTCSLGVEDGFVVFFLRGHREYPLLAAVGDDPTYTSPAFKNLDQLFKTFKAALRDGFTASGMHDVYSKISLQNPTMTDVPLDKNAYHTMRGYKIVSNIPFRRDGQQGRPSFGADI